MPAVGATFRVEREHDVPARMRDGTVLRADVYRPRGTGPFPVALQRTPYGKWRPDISAHAEALAARGYLVILQDIRGRYASEGEFDPFYSATHGDACITDGYDTVGWAARLPESNGRVGTFGVSYNSWTQWKLAAARPPSLGAMFAGGMCPDSRSVWPGIFTRDRQLQWTMYTLAPDTRRRRGLPGPHDVAEAQRQWEQLDRGKWLWFEPLSEMPTETLGGLADGWAYWLAHHHEDWFGFAATHAEIDVPVYHVTSWYDRFLATTDQYNGMIRNGRSAKTRQSQKMLIGPWSHGFNFGWRIGIMDYGPDAELDLATVSARWLDYWLKDIDTGIMDEPPVRLFVMGQNAWRDEHEWPLARTRYTTFYLHSSAGANTPAGDGSLSLDPPADEPPDQYTYDPRNPVMSLYLPSAQPGPCDARLLDHRQDVLVYQTPPLERDTEVTGPIEVTLYASSSAVDTDWTARLVDVHPDGFAVNLGYGILRARYREGWSAPSLLEPDRVYAYSISILPTSNLFRAGHRIRLDISSSDCPSFERNHNTGEDDWASAQFVTAHQRVFHDAGHASRVVLPIIP